MDNLLDHGHTNKFVIIILIIQWRTYMPVNKDEPEEAIQRCSAWVFSCEFAADFQNIFS